MFMYVPLRIPTGTIGNTADPEVRVLLHATHCNTSFTGSGGHCHSAQLNSRGGLIIYYLCMALSCSNVAMGEEHALVQSWVELCILALFGFCDQRINPAPPSEVIDICTP